MTRRPRSDCQPKQEHQLATSSFGGLGATSADGGSASYLNSLKLWPAGGRHLVFGMGCAALCSLGRLTYY